MLAKGSKTIMQRIFQFTHEPSQCSKDPKRFGKDELPASMQVAKSDKEREEMAAYSYNHTQYDVTLYQHLLHSHTKTPIMTDLQSSQSEVTVQTQPDGPSDAFGVIRLVGDGFLRMNFERFQEVADVFVLAGVEVGDLFTFALLSAVKSIIWK
jgi:hypothetical protein